MRLAPLACAAFASAACFALACGGDVFTTGYAGGGGADASAPPDGGATEAGAGGDGAPDAPASGTYCASLPTPSLFCNDFDTANRLYFGFDSTTVTINGRLELGADAYVSAPNSLVASATGDAVALGRTRFDGRYQTFQVAFALRADALPANGGKPLVIANLLVDQPANAPVYAFGVALTSTGLVAIENKLTATSAGSPTAFAPVDVPFTSSTWIDVVMVATFPDTAQPAAFTVTARAAGTTSTSTDWTWAPPAAYSNVGLEVGGQSNALGRAWKVRYDNVVVTGQVK